MEQGDPALAGAGPATRSLFRVIDAVNGARRLLGVPDVVLDSALIAAAATHSRDMALQKRAWHFGSDASSPLDRLRRVGYTGVLLGEAVSETYESAIDTLAAWMHNPPTKQIILNPLARQVGFAGFKDHQGKKWWTLIVGYETIDRVW